MSVYRVIVSLTAGRELRVLGVQGFRQPYEVVPVDLGCQDFDIGAEIMQLGKQLSGIADGGFDLDPAVRGRFFCDGLIFPEWALLDVSSGMGACQDLEFKGRAGSLELGSLWIAEKVH